MLWAIRFIATRARSPREVLIVHPSKNELSALRLVFRVQIIARAFEINPNNEPGHT